MEVVQQSGRGVPDDIAVIGFDNWEVLTADSAPPLTSLDLNLEGSDSERRSSSSRRSRAHRHPGVTPSNRVWSSGSPPDSPHTGGEGSAAWVHSGSEWS